MLLYTYFTLYMLRKDRLQPVATGLVWSFLFLSNLETGNRNFAKSVQLQLVVRSFAVGLSSVVVIFLVHSTGPANTR
jgi:hypothetical protein